MDERTTPEAKTKEDAEYIEQSLSKITRMLVGDEEEQRERAICVLREAHPTVALALAVRLVGKLQVKDEVRRRAHLALVAAGRRAVAAISEAAVKTRSTPFQLRLIALLLDLGRNLVEQDRTLLNVTILTLFSISRKESVRTASFGALKSL